MDIPPPLPEGIPPALPDLPEPQPADVHDVLRVSDPAPVLVNNQYGKTKVQWTSLPIRKARKVLEICTWTMMISTLALEHPNGRWEVCTPVSIEHDFDVLTPEGRRRREEYIYREKPDLIVGEWMCGPFSSPNHINWIEVTS